MPDRGELPQDLHPDDREPHRSRLFAVEVRRSRRLSATFLLVTFAGPDLARYLDRGFDDHVKILLIAPEGLPVTPIGHDWYRKWRSHPTIRAHPMRTYTTWAVRPAAQEVDILFALHEHGEVAQWAASAQPGARAILVGPDAHHAVPNVGVSFRPPPRVASFLVVGDETATPAIARILAALPAEATGHAFIEIPAPDSAIAIMAPSALGVTWLVRESPDHLGSLLSSETVDYAKSKALALRGQGADSLDESASYIWMAGEAGRITTLARTLREVGVAPKDLHFSGYWRLGMPGT